MTKEQIVEKLRSYGWSLSFSRDIADELEKQQVTQQQRGEP